MTISGRATIAGVMGWPVSQSRSPLMHNHWISILGLEAAYVPMAVRPERLHEAIRALPALGFKGANITVPHKQAALKACDILDHSAKRIQAVNTIVVHEDGRIEGRNTDAIGFAESLRAESCATGNSGATALVLGAGGAARAIIAALADLKFARILIANRTAEHAAAVAAAFAGEKARIETIAWDQRDEALDDVSLVVNTTSLGMVGQPPLEIDLAPLAQGSVVADIVYSPLETPLLRMARELGFTCVGGLRMLIEQARPGFAAWFGETPPVDQELIDMLEDDIKTRAG